jgi:NhaP-type Na+/H+ or K+/H+ antiporter
MKNLSVISVICLFCTLFPPPVVAYESEDEDFIIYLFLSLFLGSFFSYIISRFLPDLPYTVTIFVLGAIFAISFHNVSEENLFKISIAQWEGFNGELIIYIFLPALLFGHAMSLSFHRVKQNLGSGLILAVPGAVASALGAAFFAKYVFPYNWGWDLCLLFGAVTCATDPVGKKRWLMSFLCCLTVLSFFFVFLSFSRSFLSFFC